MAGNYPDVPAPRMAYDRDGTIGYWWNTSGAGANSGGTMTGTQLRNLNSETAVMVSSGISGTSSSYFGFIFPQLRDVVAYTNFRYFDSNGNTYNVGSIETSVNTTNGVDGTWTNRGASTPLPATSNGIIPAYRIASNQTAVTWSGIKAIRINSTNNWHSPSISNTYLYGSMSAGQTPDRLRFWHPTLDEPLDDATSSDGGFLDFGDATRGTTADKTFRIKNNSASLTANTITIGLDVLTDASPTLTTQFTLSDGGAFGATVSIASLAPGAISPVITIRRTTPSNAALVVWTIRITADPVSWS